MHHSEGRRSSFVCFSRPRTKVCCSTDGQGGAAAWYTPCSYDKQRTLENVLHWFLPAQAIKRAQGRTCPPAPPQQRRCHIEPRCEQARPGAQESPRLAPVSRQSTDLADKTALVLGHDPNRRSQLLNRRSSPSTTRRVLIAACVAFVFSRSSPGRGFEEGVAGLVVPQPCDTTLAVVAPFKSLPSTLPLGALPLAPCLPLSLCLLLRYPCHR